MHAQVGGIRPADDAEHKRRAADERRDRRGHDPVPRSAGNFDGVALWRDHAPLVRNEPGNQVIGHARSLAVRLRHPGDSGAYHRAKK